MRRVAKRSATAIPARAADLRGRPGAQSAADRASRRISRVEAGPWRVPFAAGAASGHGQRRRPRKRRFRKFVVRRARGNGSRCASAADGREAVVPQESSPPKRIFSSSRALPLGAGFGIVERSPAREACRERRASACRETPPAPSSRRPPGRPVKPQAREATNRLPKCPNRTSSGFRFQAVSKSNPTTLRSSRLNSTPIRWTERPRWRYLSA